MDSCEVESDLQGDFIEHTIQNGCFGSRTLFLRHQGIRKARPQKKSDGPPALVIGIFQAMKVLYNKDKKNTIKPIKERKAAIWERIGLLPDCACLIRRLGLAHKLRVFVCSKKREVRRLSI